VLAVSRSTANRFNFVLPVNGPAVTGHSSARGWATSVDSCERPTLTFILKIIDCQLDPCKYGSIKLSAVVKRLHRFQHYSLNTDAVMTPERIFNQGVYRHPGIFDQLLQFRLVQLSSGNARRFRKKRTIINYAVLLLSPLKHISNISLLTLNGRQLTYLSLSSLFSRDFLYLCALSI
jgi:hypothetical protein